MEINIKNAILLCAIMLWLWKCIVKKPEGKYKIVRTLGGRRVRGISGVTGKVVNDKGEIVAGSSEGSYEFIPWPFSLIDTYLFNWAEYRSSKEVTLVKDSDIVAGDREKDAEIMLQRSEYTNVLLSQHDYAFSIKNLETGERKKEEKKKEEGKKEKPEPPTPPNPEPQSPQAEKDKVEDKKVEEEKKKAEDPASPHHQPQNVKVTCNVNSTIVMKNIFQARYQAGGKADWYRSVVATITGTLGEVVSDRTFGELSEIKGEKLQDVHVKNTEPKHGSIVRDELGKPVVENGQQKRYQSFFLDENGNQLERITFIQRINYEVLVVKKLGVELTNITLVDYEMDTVSKKYADALADNAIAGVQQDTAVKKAEAITSLLRPRIRAAQTLIRESADQINRIKSQEDVTKVREAEHQTQMRMKVLGGTGNEYENMMPSIDKLINTVLGLEVSKDLNQDTSEENSKNDKKDEKKKEDKKKDYKGSKQKGGRNEK